MTVTESLAPVSVAGMPRIGDPAPAFTAVTTQGEINFPADYAGKWVIFFSHPADFTPVCTSEFMTFASMQEQFASYNTELVGLSVEVSTATSPGCARSRTRSPSATCTTSRSPSRSSTKCRWRSPRSTG
jgi:peroxiredoxin